MTRTLLFLLLVTPALAQQTSTQTTRVLFATRDVTTSGTPVALQDFKTSLPHPPVPPGEWIISDPRLQTTVALLHLTPAEYEDLQIYSNQHRDLLVEVDQRMSPTADPVVPDPPPTGWALTSLLSALPYGLPIHEGCRPCQVTLYAVDTGVQRLIPSGSGSVPHPQFTVGSPVVWGAGLMAPSLIGTGATPFDDTYNHGTGVASTAVGKDTGLFAHLQGGSVLLEPCQIYFPFTGNLLQPWVADAVNVIFQASVLQLAKRSDASLTNDAAVLLFANRTNNAYSEILERQMAAAATAGIVVVGAAGNASSNIDPSLPATTTPMPNGCFPLALITQITPAAALRSPAGLPLNKVLADIFAPCFTYATPPAEQMILVGGYTNANTLSINTNYGLATHLFAPGENVIRAKNNGAGLVTGSGTSYAAGYAAGLALYYLSFRPWATVAEVRSFVLAQSDLTAILPPANADPAMLIHKMRLDTMAAPDCCLDYETWATHRGLSGADASKLADPDTDGLLNLVEWALNNDPSAPGTNRGLSLTQHGGHFYLHLSRASYHVCGARFNVEASLDLNDWTALVPVFTDLPTPPGCEQNRESEALLPEEPTKKFYRLRIDAP